MFLYKCVAIGQDTIKKVVFDFFVSKQTNFLGKQTCQFVSGLKIEYRHEHTFKTYNMHEKFSKNIGTVSYIPY